MTISDAVRQQVIDYSGSMTAVEIAKRLGIGRATVQRIQKAYGANPRASKRNDAPKERASKSESTHAREHRPATSGKASIVSEIVVQPEPEVMLSPIRQIKGQPRTSYVSPSDVAQTLIQHLNSEIELYEKAKAKLDTGNGTASWEVVNHEKLVQSSVQTLAKWFGMDKGDVLKAIEDIRNDPFATMSKDELLKLYEVTQ